MLTISSLSPASFREKYPPFLGKAGKTVFFIIFKGRSNGSAKPGEPIWMGVYNPIVGVDKYGRINIFNKASSKVTGAEQMQAYGKDTREIFNNSQLTNIVRAADRPELLRRIDTVGKPLSSRSPVVVDNEIVGAVAAIAGNL